jgi:hypothetical protein
MNLPPPTAYITFTQPCLGLWLISLNGEHVGTVAGNGTIGFTARDTDYRFVGRDDGSPEAAMRSFSR